MNARRLFPCGRVSPPCDRRDFLARAAVDRVSVHDLHATMLHLLGLDHERLPLPGR